MPVLQAGDIRKQYSEGQHVVDVLKGVSLSLKRGEIVALEGPSGSGKTTLLCILGCLLSPSAGRVVVAGNEVDPTRPDQLWKFRRDSIGFVFQQFNLFPSLSASENVEYALNIKGFRGVKAKKEAARVLGDVGLSHRLDFLPRDLSGGQKQRVAIARALVGHAPIILADEPTGNLDSEAGGHVLELFQRLARREHRALLIATHDPRVRSIVDRVLAIRDGRLELEEAA
jgi:putative ABC transport system ATP-binding protein